jgi:hypothetical protein
LSGSGGGGTQKIQIYYTRESRREREQTFYAVIAIKRENLQTFECETIEVAIKAQKGTTALLPLPTDLLLLSFHAGKK